MANQIQPPPQYPSYFPPYHPHKDKGTALILEILPGLFGLYGFGRIYSGDTQTGVIWLVCGIVWSLIAVIIDIGTGGFACFCTLPVNIACVIITATTLNSYINQHPEIFN